MPLLVLTGLFGAAVVLSVAGGASASSYGGTGDWAIPSNSTETVITETINVSGNLTVDGTLNLIASTVVIDRNITVSGTLRIWATNLTLTVDGPGTNTVDVRSGAALELLDLDGNPATTADAGLLRADAFGFTATVAPNATLRIENSIVRNAGFFSAQPSVSGAGFSANGALVRVENSTFYGGWEVLLVRGQTNLTVTNATFDGAVVALNVTGGGGQQLSGITLVNHTYGITLHRTNATNVSALTVRPPQPVAYRPGGTGPAGSGIDVDGCTNLTVDGVSIQGLPPPVGLLAHSGFQVRGSSSVLVQQVSSVWAGAVGSILGSTGVRILESVVSDTMSPLTVTNSSAVTFVNFSAQNGASGIALVNVSGWTVDGFLGVGLSGGAVTGSSLWGAGTMANFTVESGPQVAALTWTAAGAFSSTNVTALTVGSGLRVQGPAGLSLYVNGFHGEAMTDPALFVDVAGLDGAFISNIWVNVTGATSAVLLNGTQLTNSTIGPVDVLEADQVGLTVSYRFVNGTIFRDITADNVSGQVMVLQAAGGVFGSTFLNLRATNTTGVVVNITSPVVQSIAVAYVTVVDGLTVPADADGSLVINTDSLSGGNFTNFLILRSRVSAVNITAGAPSSFNITGVQGLEMSGPGVSIHCRDQVCNARVSQVTLVRSLGTGVLMQHSAGGITVNQLVTDSAWGVWADAVRGASVDAMLHNGTAAGVGLVNCVGVTVSNASLRGGAGLVAEGGTQLSLLDSISSVGGSTVEARLTDGVTVSRLVFVDAGSGFRLLGVANALVQDLSGSVNDYVLFASQDASSITVRRVQMGTSAGGYAGVVVTATRVTGLSITDFNYTAPCSQSGTFDRIQGLDLARFTSNGCATGIQVSNSRAVNMTALALKDVGGNFSISVSSSSDVRIQGAELQRAGGDALSLGGGPRVWVSGVNASGSRGDGAILLFLHDAVIQDSVFDRAAALGLFFVGAGPNLTIVNVTADASAQGVDMFSSQGVLLDGVSLSYNFGNGFTSDETSTGNTLRGLRVVGNGGSGLVIYGNGTAIVDGYFAQNQASAIVAAPFVRYDWTVVRSATLADDGINLTGDLDIQAGATFRLVRARIVIDQAARLAAFQPVAVINVSASGLFDVLDGVVAPRDVTVPYAVVVAPGGALSWRNATFSGGNSTSPLSAIRLQSATADIRGGAVAGWHFPLDATSSNITVDGTRFQDSWSGPRVSGGTARFANVSSLSNMGDGLGAVGADRVELENFAAFNNGGAGARIQTVVLARLVNFDSRANDAEGLVVLGSTVQGSGLSLVGNGGEGLLATSGSAVAIDVLEANSNGRSGAWFDDSAPFALTSFSADMNGGSGLRLTGFAAGTVQGAAISRNAAFGIHAAGTGTMDVLGADVSDDFLGAIRVEGSFRLSLGQSTVQSSADYGVAAIENSNVTLTDIVATAIIAPLIASDNASADVVNSTVDGPIVVGNAVAWIRWNVRVIVQNSSGGPAGSVAVEIFNGAGARVGGGTTGADGVMPLVTVTERVLHGDGTGAEFGPYVFEANSSAQGRARHRENVTRFLSLGLRLDDQAPTLSVEYNQEAGAGGWFLGPVEATLRGFDDRSDGVTLLYRVPGGAWVTVDSNISLAVATLAVDREGVTQVEVVVRDAAGNEHGPELIDIRVDLGRPTGFFGPVQAVYYEPSFVLSWGGTDGNGSGVATYRLEFTKNSGPPTIFLNGTTLTQMRFNGTDGLYEFRLTVFDAAGRSSPLASVSVEFALVGAFRVRVLDPGGASIANTTLLVEDLNVTLAGQGDLEITGLPSGNHTLVISAPGHKPVRMEVNITAHQTLDLGQVTLESDVSPMPLELVVLWGLLAGVGLATVGYWVYIRQKWSGKRGGKPGEK